jgi:putative copper export protein
MLSAVPLWIHVIAATIWVGSQVMMFVVVIPSVRLTEGATRQQLMASVTTRFGYLGFGALLLLVLTGLDNINRYAPSDVFDHRYGYILAIKLIMVAAVIGLTALHTMSLGPRLLALQSRPSVPGAEVASMRRQSIIVSVTTLLLSIAILLCAVLLRTTYAYG